MEVECSSCGFLFNDYEDGCPECGYIEEVNEEPDDYEGWPWMNIK